MINILSFIGEPIHFLQDTFVYPPTIKDVISNPNYFKFLKVLTMSEEDLQDELKDYISPGQEFPSPFIFLLSNCYKNKEIEKLTSMAFEFFTKEKAVIMYEEKTIVLFNANSKQKEKKALENLTKITEENFTSLQNIIRISIGRKPVEPPPPIDPDEDPRVRRIKEKARMRDRIKEKQQSKGKNGISFSQSLIAICCMGIGLTPLNIGEISYCSVGKIMNACQAKEAYDLDIQKLMAGADPKKIKPKYWIKEISD